MWQGCKEVFFKPNPELNLERWAYDEMERGQSKDTVVNDLDRALAELDYTYMFYSHRRFNAQQAIERGVYKYTITHLTHDKL